MSILLNYRGGLKGLADDIAHLSFDKQEEFLKQLSNATGRNVLLPAAAKQKNLATRLGKAASLIKEASTHMYFASKPDLITTTST